MVLEFKHLSEKLDNEFAKVDKGFQRLDRCMMIIL